MCHPWCVAQPQCRDHRPRMPALATVQPLNVPAPSADEPNKRLKIGTKLRVAIDAIVFEGQDFADAAQTAKCTVRSIRRAFEKAHVLAYLKKRREVLRAAARGQNIRRLVEIRDAADNMPAVNAIKALEMMDDGGSIEGSARRSPGLVIIVQGSAAHVPSARDLPQVIENTEDDR